MADDLEVSHRPSWLETEKDEEFRKEAAPLVADEDDIGSYGATADDEPEPDSLEARGRKERPHAPRDNPFLWMFHFLEGMTVITASCLFTTQVIPICYVRPAQWPEKIGLLSLALKMYIASFCVMFALVELDWSVPIIRSSPLLQNYVSRGFLYSFLGLICVEESTSDRIKEIVNRSNDTLHVSWASIFMQISSWCFLVVGFLYILLGICCMRRLRNQLKETEREERRKYREDMKKWSEIYD